MVVADQAGGVITSYSIHYTKLYEYADWMKTVDDSDCATYWTLLGDWGVSLDDIASNGVNTPEVEQANEAAFFQWAPRIRQELLRRVQAAAPEK